MARGRADALIAPHARLNLAFFVLIGVMAAHESEHFAQVVQKDVTRERCPEDCRGLLGFVFDVEWVHFAYNWSILAALVGLFLAYRLWERPWREAAPGAWLALFGGIFVVQAYHGVEHAAKLAQWLANGGVSPTPGILGHPLDPARGLNFSLVELHFAFNTVVFALVVTAYFGFGFHRHITLPRRVPAWAPALAVALPLLGASALAWATQTPTVRLAAGVHQGPLVLDRAQKLVGEEGAVVRGGIRVLADGVTVRDVTVRGGENGIELDGAEGVVLDGVRVVGAELDGISLRRSSARIYDCVVESRGRYAQGIDISFSIDLAPSLVSGCRVTGGQEGIVTHSARVDLRGNHVARTTMRGITVTEMSMGRLRRNLVEDALGIGIFCGDYSHCDVERNVVVGTRPDATSGDGLGEGVGVLSHFGAVATLRGNELDSNPLPTMAWARGRFESDDG